MRVHAHRALPGSPCRASPSAGLASVRHVCVTQPSCVAVDDHGNMRPQAGFGGAAAGGGGGGGANEAGGSAAAQQSEFARRAARIGQGIAATSQNLLKLSGLAKRTGKFDDPAVEIANVSAVIKQDIQALNVALVDLQNLSAAQRGGAGGGGTSGGRQSASHSSTVVDSLRLRLKDTTKDFQNVLQVPCPLPGCYSPS